MTKMLMDYKPADVLLDVSENNPYELAYRLRAASKEPWTVAWLEALDPQTAMLIDIGANVGSYSLIAGSRGIRTLAVEPGSASYAKLVENVRINKLEEWVAPVCCVLGPGLGLYAFNYSDLAAGAASHNGAKTVWTQKLLGLPVDALAVAAGTPITHIKLDVDGAEVHVLKGAETTLKTLQGALVEVNHGNVKGVAELLQAAGMVLVKTHDRRNGQPIPDVVYQEWRRE